MSGRSASLSNWLSLAVVAGAIGLAGPDAALPVFTLSPSALGGGGTGVPDFTADDLTLSDYTTITLTPTGQNTSSFTESGTLDVVQAQLGNANVSTPLNTRYGMYFSFTASGNQTNGMLGGVSVSSGNFTWEGSVCMAPIATEAGGAKRVCDGGGGVAEEEAGLEGECHLFDDVAGDGF